MGGAVGVGAGDVAGLWVGDGIGVSGCPAVDQGGAVWGGALGLSASGLYSGVKRVGEG